MINSVRGSHSSPGVYTREIDYTFTAKSLGITRLGLAGETLKGPAFEPIRIERWSDFEAYFGGTSTEKYKGNGIPKYELPYIAQEYLKESPDLLVCRVLGLSGYDAGKAFPICVSNDGTNYLAAILRSKKKYSDPSSGSTCESQPNGDEPTDIITSVTISAYTKLTYDSNCNVVATATTDTQSLTLDSDNLGRFTITAFGSDGTYTYPVSFNENEKDYIYNVIGSDPLGSTPLYIEYLYDYALEDMVKNASSGSSITIVTGASNPSELHNDYRIGFKEATTPWILSEVKSNGGTLNMKELFKFHTISDGKTANKDVKVSIQNIRPDSGTFDVAVRAFNDSDNAPVILEKFSKLTMEEGDPNFIGLRIGTDDGSYELKSKYIMVELGKDIEDLRGSVPCGFEGYELHNTSSGFTGTIKNMPVNYNTVYDRDIKAKKQYFGFSTIAGVDEDVLSYKGKYTELSNGFHLDSILSDNFNQGDTNKVYINGKASNQKFSAVDPNGNLGEGNKIPRIISEEYMKGTIYQDVNLRKFTVCFAGGFDGWDVNRSERTNTDDFKATKYNGKFYNSGGVDMPLNLPLSNNTSDYYAYLAAYRQFANPQETSINLFATPGIDFVNNSLLVADALDMIEDPDDGRGGDALYIVSSPNKVNSTDSDPVQGTDAEEIVDLLENTNIDSSYICTYWPWVKVLDGVDNKYIDLPVTKDVVRNMAMVDNKFASW